MTEAEWLAWVEPAPLLDSLPETVTNRKLRLFAVACCRRIWHLLPDERSRAAVEIAEAFADGRVGLLELEEAHQAAWDLAENEGYDSAFDAQPGSSPDWGYEAHEIAVDVTRAASACSSASAGQVQAMSTAAEAAEAMAHAAEPLRPGSAYQRNTPARLAARTGEETTQAALLRCIFGNPFRPATADPSWLTSTVTALARGIYADRAFDRLPILADALQDAGCDHPDILTHCRAAGPHARGCWVVDLVLGLS